MEEGRNIPLIVMLSAGSVICIACIVFKMTLLQTLLYVLFTLIGFYLIGLIIKKIIVSINRDAEERAALIAQELAEAKMKEEAEKEELQNKDAKDGKSEGTENGQEEITVS